MPAPADAVRTVEPARLPAAIAAAEVAAQGWRLSALLA